MKDGWNPYNTKGFSFLIFTKVLFDVFSYEDRRRNSP